MSANQQAATHTNTATQSQATPASLESYAATADILGRMAVRYSLAGVLLVIGAMKFTAYEAEAISGLVSNSPLMASAYSVFSVRGLGVAIGITELLIASLIAIRPWSAKLSAVGSVLAIGMFLTTLSFMFSTPGVVEASLGFPALSVMPGQFLVKDIALLGIAIWTLGDSWQALRADRQ